MKIRCDSEKEFYDTIKALVERGLGFEASSFKLEITLTGSY